MGDDLEPGQDDLVKDESAARAIARKARHIHLSTVGSEEELYTDHKAGDPAALTPAAEQDPTIERNVGSPVRASLLDRLRAGVVRMGDLLPGGGSGDRRSR